MNHRIQYIHSVERRTWGERRHGGEGVAFSCGDRGWGENMGKHPSPKAAGEKVENWKQDLNSTKTINRGSAESETPQLDIWRCSGGKGKS